MGKGSYMRHVIVIAHLMEKNRMIGMIQFDEVLKGPRSFVLYSLHLMDGHRRKINRPRPTAPP